MSGSSGIGQLLKGIVMGVVLILAIVGTMSMLDKKDGSSSDDTQTTATGAETPAPEVQAPEINIASQTPTQTATETNPPESEKKPIDTADPDYKPVLEGEKTAEEVEAEQKAAEEAAKPKFGILKLSTINPENNKSLMADYVVVDSRNNKVAESNNSSNASYRLPVGTYKVITTLSKSTSSTRNTEPVQSTQSIIISANKITDEVFKLEPPTTIGVLQVSAINANNKKSMKANFIVQKENGETVASRNNVTNTLFKLKAGSYKVTVKSGNNSDFRTIVVDPGESTNEVFKLQESFLQGKVLVRIFETNSDKPVSVDIIISASNGNKIQELKSVSRTEIALAAGNYTVQATAPNSQLSKKITVVAGQAINQIFRFDAPTATATPTPENQATDDSATVTDDVKITGVEPEKDTPTPNKTDTKTPTEETVDTNKGLGIIKLFAHNDETQKPIKSNFYVQTLNGRNVDKKIYADTAEFKLKPGKYKITVRSKGHKNIVRNIQINADKTVNQAFSLKTTLPPAATAPHDQKANIPTRSTAPPKPAKEPKTIPNGFLYVAMQPARNTHFVIANRQGKKIVELTSVPSGNFKLDTGTYIVTAIHNKQQRRKTVQVRQGKTTHLNFNLADFQAAQPKQTPKGRGANDGIKKGVLRSHIVDNNGRHLRGDLTVTNMQGQVVARSNSVTVGVFDLPAAPHTVIVNYKGLRGSERVNITAGQTTVQTFTISPNNSRPAPVKKQQTPKEILRKKLEEELQKAF